jgi:hypothetical protein
MRVLEDRCTTIRREMMTLTTIPTSTSQMMENRNVRNIRARSIHASILGEKGKAELSRRGEE